MIVSALKSVIRSGGIDYPIFIGFLTAEQLLKVAEVPNFKDSTPNHDIANNVLTPPVKQWQRPLIKERVTAIVRTFNNTGEFMPNPVLVAERSVGPKPDIHTSSQNAQNGVPTDIQLINIPEPKNNEAPPLWIIDGQHRITGLGDKNCAQNDNPIPVVFLLNSGTSTYNGRNLAKIFAQVTTEATPLDPLHKEWLTFAFELSQYSEDVDLRSSMQTVALLCKKPIENVTKSHNIFHDNIKFNDKLAVKNKDLGHLYDCKDISTLISEYYFKKDSVYPHLDAESLSDQIALAFNRLKSHVKAPQEKSVFFGDKKFSQKIMIDAYLVGVLAFLRKRNYKPQPQDWDNLLTSLNFKQTDWNFQQHVEDSRRWVDKSKKLAFDVFESFFSTGQLPDGVSNIWDFLSGDQLFIEIEFRHINDNERAIKTDAFSQKFGRGDKKTISMDGRKYFKVIDKSINAKHIEIYDEKSSPSDPTVFKQNGEFLIYPKVKSDNPSQSPLVLTIKLFLYGGIEEKLTISLANWNE